MLVAGKRKKRCNHSGRIRKDFRGRNWASSWKMAPILAGRGEEDMKLISRYETRAEMLMIANTGNEQVTAIWFGQSQFSSAWKYLQPNWGSYPSQAPLKASSPLMVLFFSELIKSFHFVRYHSILPLTKPRWFLIYFRYDSWSGSLNSLKPLIEATKK